MTGRYFLPRLSDTSLLKRCYPRLGDLILLGPAEQIIGFLSRNSFTERWEGTTMFGGVCEGVAQLWPLGWKMLERIPAPLSRDWMRLEMAFVDSPDVIQAGGVL